MPISIKNLLLFLLLSLFCFTLSATGGESLKNLPFNEGEDLVYEISWFGIPAGTGRLHVNEKTVKDGKEVFHIDYSAVSSDFLSSFYRVEDRAETFMDSAGLFPWSFKLKIREGRTKRDVETVFDQIGHKAAFKKDKDEPVEVSIPPAVQDAFSSLYYLRTKNLIIGEKVIIDVFEDKKSWQVEVHVLKKERIKIYSEEVDTILVKPLLKYEGIFQRKGDVYIWLTDDEKKIPVQLRTKVIIGSVYAKIISMNGVKVITSAR
ncbi:MAG: DUF3108 domain-containing protein [Nitrospinae bacterium]|nr:DUF3108 domain-containing protein [Nitrospinota bacterium]